MQAEQNPFHAPEADLAPPPRSASRPGRYRYAGFWIRFVAVFIDGLILGIPSFLIMYGIWGDHYLDDPSPHYNAFEVVLDYVVPLIYSVWFWVARGATPGKMLVGLRVIDQRSGEIPGFGQAVGRYFGYLLSGLILGIGYIMAGFDDRKRSLHDRLCNTYVVHKDSIEAGRRSRRPRSVPPRPAQQDEAFVRHDEEPLR